MSYINGYAVYVDGINRTHNAVMPLKWADYLDERLDEANLPFRLIKKDSFSPLTPVEIVLSNKLYFGGIDNAQETTSAEKRTKHFLVADDKAQENPVGSGYYDHDLTLIEATKYAECITRESRTLTNDIGKNYTANAKPVVPEEE